jgi:cell wall-associated NlpC family hydrolase
MKVVRKNHSRTRDAVIFANVMALLAPCNLFAQPGVSRAEILRTRALMTSRDALMAQESPTSTVTGRLALVSLDNAPIIAPREQFGRLLSRCSQGTYIIVTGETSTYYSVIMADHSLGFILRSSVQLLDYQIAAPTPTTLGSVSPLAQSLVQTAMQYLDVPYVWGGNDATGIDCSGLVKAVYASNGISLPRTAAQQATLGYSVPLNDLSQWQPGDRMYFQCHHSYIDHTGMYVGNGYFVHSSIGNHGVQVTRVDAPFYWSHLVAVRRSPELVQNEQTAQANPASPDYESSQQ